MWCGSISVVGNANLRITLNPRLESNAFFTTDSLHTCRFEIVRLSDLQYEHSAAPALDWSLQVF